MKDSLRSLKTALLVTGICVAGVAAQAQLTITQSGTAPTENIYKHTPPPVGSNSVTAYKRAELPAGATSGTLDRTLGQAFSTEGAAGNLSLEALTFQIGSLSNLPSGLSVSISIYEATAASYNPAHANTSLISKQVGNLPDALVVGNFITFSLDQTVTLAADRYYSVIFAFEELSNPGTAVSSIGFSVIGSGVSNADLGAGARRWLGDDGAWSGSATNGFVLYIEAAPAIPESSTYALLGGVAATLLVLAVRRRRQCR